MTRFKQGEREMRVVAPSWIIGVLMADYIPSLIADQQFTSDCPWIRPVNGTKSDENISKSMSKRQLAVRYPGSSLRPLARRVVQVKAAGNLALRVTADHLDLIEDGIHSVELDSIEHGPEKAMEFGIFHLSARLDLARRQVPVSKDLGRSLTQPLHPHLHCTQSYLVLEADLYISYQSGTSPSPGWTITNARRCCNEAPSFTFHPNSFVRAFLSSPVEGHYNFPTQYSSANTGTMSSLMIRSCGLQSHSIKSLWITSNFIAAQPKPGKPTHTFALV